ncbi:MAG: prepilin-type N-terminal cleavage/methylation domain-containing protein [Candidatus Chisholmbacteria bacterium]|nr:prepilin-type N-terminal cleavage/methylation domain-containing protein [Candidatus Chisholmbacteria bacterium]
MKGYSLLELVVVVAATGVLAVVATNLFFSVTRGGTKVQLAAEVNQNGQIVLGVMERLIRNAYSVLTCSGAAETSLTVVDRTGQNVTFACENVGTDESFIASNGARLTSEKVAVSACSFKCVLDQGGYRPPLVEIDFWLRQANTQAVTGETAEAEFKTSVGLRNY